MIQRMMSTASSENVSVSMHDDGIAVVSLDIKNSKVNTLGKALLTELPPILETLENVDDPHVKSVIFISAKKNNFIAGADINIFDEIAVQGKDAIKKQVCQLTQGFFDRMEKGKVKIAAIDGSCLGGGAEFALACHYRIASVNPSTAIGFPEVMLGLLPGAGGTQRLPKLIGVQGLTQDATKLLQCALATARLLNKDLNFTSKTGEMKLPKRGELPWMSAYFEDGIKSYSFLRDFYFGQARKMALKQTNGNYPAPIKIIEVLEGSIAKNALGKDQGYEMEADAFAELALTKESSGLRSLFFGQTSVKKNPFSGAMDVKKVGVLGAGLMGSGIAEVTIAKGVPVVLKDVSAKGLSVGETNIQKSMQDKVKKKRMTSFEKDVTMSRLIGVHNDMPSWKDHIKQCDLVVEAVFEDLSLKHKIVEEMESICKPDCIIATNTSSLPVSEIAKFSSRPHNIVGMHYFSPVPKMQLLEIIPHETTDEKVIATAVQLGLKQGKLPIVCKDVPGFFVNRCLGPYIDESMVLAFEVDDILKLDKALKKFGFPVGPMVLADEVGVDVAFHLHNNLIQDLGVRMSGANIEAMKAIKAAGIKGKRFGCGFLVYPPKKASGLAALNPFASKPSPTPNPVALEAMKPFMKPGKA
ncbi:hypothetical protein GUITHDRAFT_121132 [Guillardia theta CCMP2712]|uniref:enoyl-CoA hydratase n=1 Tax=Guillardia theta (strain CCMP2712) TaxID=905079 RepID=L1I9B1_GUITC|nr:hypothetical protein GUITHDRAFT_121132 [Guillardia theta CCMP2712]EKX32692.1 hypothetical protein GUITHDRAFT_121132 [Guillardia theta CCMP2712]|eukprot:XP_005819672.1 hypothetical protein GUITHDRAFT_121132 [Guillardia theta CCMP2712]